MHATRQSVEAARTRRLVPSHHMHPFREGHPAKPSPIFRGFFGPILKCFPVVYPRCFITSLACVRVRTRKITQPQERISKVIFSTTRRVQTPVYGKMERPSQSRHFRRVLPWYRRQSALCSRYLVPTTSSTDKFTLIMVRLKIDQRVGTIYDEYNYVRPPFPARARLTPTDRKGAGGVDAQSPSWPRRR